MARAKQSIVFLDTHVVVWLYAGLIEKITEKAKDEIEKRDIHASRIVKLELQYLNEIGRITVKPTTIINSLSKSIGLKLSDLPFSTLIDEAIKINWTRDVFDRLLTSEAKLNQAGLITADRTIQINYKKSVW